MAYYIFVYNGQINGRGCAECISDGWLNVEVSKEVFDTIETYGNDYYIYENGEIILNPNYQAIKLAEAKELKKQENAQIRDEKLLAGVTFKDVLFDSDTDQKVNLGAQIDFMDDTETVNWYGMNSVSYVECTKADLYAIGNLIKELTSYVWTHNSEIVIAIEQAQTIEELDAIEINY